MSSATDSSGVGYYTYVDGQNQVVVARVPPDGGGPTVRVVTVPPGAKEPSIEVSEDVVLLCFLSLERVDVDGVTSRIIYIRRLDPVTLSDQEGYFERTEITVPSPLDAHRPQFCLGRVGLREFPNLLYAQSRSGSSGYALVLINHVKNSLGLMTLFNRVVTPHVTQDPDSVVRISRGRFHVYAFQDNATGLLSVSRVYAFNGTVEWTSREDPGAVTVEEPPSHILVVEDVIGVVYRSGGEGRIRGVDVSGEILWDVAIPGILSTEYVHGLITDGLSLITLRGLSTGLVQSTRFSIQGGVVTSLRVVSPTGFPTDTATAPYTLFARDPWTAVSLLRLDSPTPTFVTYDISASSSTTGVPGAREFRRSMVSFPALDQGYHIRRTASDGLRLYSIRPAAVSDVLLSSAGVFPSVAVVDNDVFVSFLTDAGGLLPRTTLTVASYIQSGGFQLQWQQELEVPRNLEAFPTQIARTEGKAIVAVGANPPRLYPLSTRRGVREGIDLTSSYDNYTMRAAAAGVYLVGARAQGGASLSSDLEVRVYGYDGAEIKTVHTGTLPVAAVGEIEAVLDEGETILYVRVRSSSTGIDHRVGIDVSTGERLWSVDIASPGDVVGEYSFFDHYLAFYRDVGGTMRVMTLSSRGDRTDEVSGVAPPVSKDGGEWIVASQPWDGYSHLYYSSSPTPTASSGFTSSLAVPVTRVVLTTGITYSFHGEQRAGDFYTYYDGTETPHDALPRGPVIAGGDLGVDESFEFTPAALGYRYGRQGALLVVNDDVFFFAFLVRKKSLVGFTTLVVQRLDKTPLNDVVQLTQAWTTERNLPDTETGEMRLALRALPDDRLGVLVLRDSRDVLLLTLYQNRPLVLTEGESLFTETRLRDVDLRGGDGNQWRVVLTGPSLDELYIGGPRSSGPGRVYAYSLATDSVTFLWGLDVDVGAGNSVVGMFLASRGPREILAATTDTAGVTHLDRFRFTTAVPRNARSLALGSPRVLEITGSLATTTIGDLKTLLGPLGGVSPTSLFINNALQTPDTRTLLAAGVVKESRLYAAARFVGNYVYVNFISRYEYPTVAGFPTTGLLGGVIASVAFYASAIFLFGVVSTPTPTTFTLFNGVVDYEDGDTLDVRTSTISGSGGFSGADASRGYSFRVSEPWSDVELALLTTDTVDTSTTTRVFVPSYAAGRNVRVGSLSVLNTAAVDTTTEVSENQSAIQPEYVYLDDIGEIQVVYNNFYSVFYSNGVTFHETTPIEASVGPHLVQISESGEISSHRNLDRYGFRPAVHVDQSSGIVDTTRGFVYVVYVKAVQTLAEYISLVVEKYNPLGLTRIWRSETILETDDFSTLYPRITTTTTHVSVVVAEVSGDIRRLVLAKADGEFLRYESTGDVIDLQNGIPATAIAVGRYADHVSVCYPLGDGGVRHRVIPETGNSRVNTIASSSHSAGIKRSIFVRQDLADRAVVTFTDSVTGDAYIASSLTTTPSTPWVTKSTLRNILGAGIISGRVVLFTIDPPTPTEDRYRVTTIKYTPGGEPLEQTSVPLGSIDETSGAVRNGYDPLLITGTPALITYAFEGVTRNQIFPGVYLVFPRPANLIYRNWQVLAANYIPEETFDTEEGFSNPSINQFAQTSSDAAYATYVSKPMPGTLGLASGVDSGVYVNRLTPDGVVRVMRKLSDTGQTPSLYVSFDGSKLYVCYTRISTTFTRYVSLILERLDPEYLTTIWSVEREFKDSLPAFFRPRMKVTASGLHLSFGREDRSIYFETFDPETGAIIPTFDTLGNSTGSSYNTGVVLDDAEQLFDLSVWSSSGRVVVGFPRGENIETGAWAASTTPFGGTTRFVLNKVYGNVSNYGQAGVKSNLIVRTSVGDKYESPGDVYVGYAVRSAGSVHCVKFDPDAGSGILWGPVTVPQSSVDGRIHGMLVYGDFPTFQFIERVSPTSQDLTLRSVKYDDEGALIEEVSRAIQPDTNFAYDRIVQQLDFSTPSTPGGASLLRSISPVVLTRSPWDQAYVEFYTFDRVKALVGGNPATVSQTIPEDSNIYRLKVVSLSTDLVPQIQVRDSEVSEYQFARDREYGVTYLAYNDNTLADSGVLLKRSSHPTPLVVDPFGQTPSIALYGDYIYVAYVYFQTGFLSSSLLRVRRVSRETFLLDPGYLSETEYPDTLTAYLRPRLLSLYPGREELVAVYRRQDKILYREQIPPNQTSTFVLRQGGSTKRIMESSSASPRSDLIRCLVSPEEGVTFSTVPHGTLTSFTVARHGYSATGVIREDWASTQVSVPHTQTRMVLSPIGLFVGFRQTGANHFTLLQIDRESPGGVVRTISLSPLSLSPNPVGQCLIGLFSITDMVAAVYLRENGEVVTEKINADYNFVSLVATPFVNPRSEILSTPPLLLPSETWREVEYVYRTSAATPLLPGTTDLKGGTWLPTPVYGTVPRSEVTQNQSIHLPPAVYTVSSNPLSTIPLRRLRLEKRETAGAVTEYVINDDLVYSPTIDLGVDGRLFLVFATRYVTLTEVVVVTAMEFDPGNITAPRQLVRVLGHERVSSDRVVQTYGDRTLDHLHPKMAVDDSTPVILMARNITATPLSSATRLYRKAFNRVENKFTYPEIYLPEGTDFSPVALDLCVEGSSDKGLALVRMNGGRNEVTIDRMVFNPRRLEFTSPVPTRALAVSGGGVDGLFVRFGTKSRLAVGVNREGAAPVVFRVNETPGVSPPAISGTCRTGSEICGMDFLRDYPIAWTRDSLAGNIVRAEKFEINLMDRISERATTVSGMNLNSYVERPYILGFTPWSTLSVSGHDTLTTTTTTLVSTPLVYVRPDASLYDADFQRNAATGEPLVNLLEDKPVLYAVNLSSVQASEPLKLYRQRGVTPDVHNLSDHGFDGTVDLDDTTENTDLLVCYSESYLAFTEVQIIVEKNLDRGKLVQALPIGGFSALVDEKWSREEYYPDVTPDLYPTVRMIEGRACTILFRNTGEIVLEVKRVDTGEVVQSLESGVYSPRPRAETPFPVSYEQYNPGTNVSVGGRFHALVLIRHDVPGAASNKYCKVVAFEPDNTSTFSKSLETILKNSSNVEDVDPKFFPEITESPGGEFFVSFTNKDGFIVLRRVSPDSGRTVWSRIVDFAGNIVTGLFDNSVPSSLSQIFVDNDLNQDGLVNQGDFVDALRRASFSLPDADLIAAFQYFDTDGDGFVDFSSVYKTYGSTSVAGLFIIFDADDDGKITKAEFDAALRNIDIDLGVLLDPVFEHLAGPDGFITFSEIFSNYTDNTIREIFDDIDTDGDGELTRVEFRGGLRRANIVLDEAFFDALFIYFAGTLTGTISFDEFRRTFQREYIPYRRVDGFGYKRLDGFATEGSSIVLNRISMLNDRNPDTIDIETIVVGNTSSTISVLESFSPDTYPKYTGSPLCFAKIADGYSFICYREEGNLAINIREVVLDNVYNTIRFDGDGYVSDYKFKNSPSFTPVDATAVAIGGEPYAREFDGVTRVLPYNRHWRPFSRISAGGSWLVPVDTTERGNVVSRTGWGANGLVKFSEETSRGNTPGEGGVLVTSPARSTLYLIYRDLMAEGRPTALRFSNGSWEPYSSRLTTPSGGYRPRVSVGGSVNTVFLSYLDESVGLSLTVARFDRFWRVVGARGFAQPVEGVYDMCMPKHENFFPVVAARLTDNELAYYVVVEGEWVRSSAFPADTRRTEIRNIQFYCLRSTYLLVERAGEIVLYRHAGGVWTELPPFPIPDSADTPYITASETTLYISFRDIDYSNRPSVYSLVGTTWAPVGARGIGDIACRDPRVAVSGTGVPHLAFSRVVEGADDKPRALRYDAAVDEWVDIADGVDFAFGASLNTTLSFVGAETYLSFVDTFDILYLWKYERGEWIKVTSQGTGIRDTVDTSILFDDRSSDAYVSYRDGTTNSAGVLVFDGFFWTPLTGTDVGDARALYLSLSTYAAGNAREPAIAYADTSRGNKLTVRRYLPTKSSWLSVGLPGFTSTAVQDTSILTFDASGTRRLFVAYREQRDTPVSRLWVWSYDFDTLMWSRVEGGLGSLLVSRVELVRSTFNDGVYMGVELPSTYKIYGLNATTGIWSVFATSPYLETRGGRIAMSNEGTFYVAGNVRTSLTQSPFLAAFSVSNLGVVTQLPATGVSNATTISISALNNTKVYVGYANQNFRAATIAYNGTTWTRVGVDGFSLGTVTSLNTILTNDNEFVGYHDNSLGGTFTLQAYNNQDSRWGVVLRNRVVEFTVNGQWNREVTGLTGDGHFEYRWKLPRAKYWPAVFDTLANPNKGNKITKTFLRNELQDKFRVLFEDDAYEVFWGDLSSIPSVDNSDPNDPRVDLEAFLQFFPTNIYTKDILNHGLLYPVLIYKAPLNDGVITTRVVNGVTEGLEEWYNYFPRVKYAEKFYETYTTTSQRSVPTGGTTVVETIPIKKSRLVSRTEYYPGGNKRIETPYVTGAVSGTVVEYHDSPGLKKKMETVMRDGRPTGAVTEYYSSGRVKKIVTPFENIYTKKTNRSIKEFFDAENSPLAVSYTVDHRSLKTGEEIINRLITVNGTPTASLKERGSYGTQSYNPDDQLGEANGLRLGPWLFVAENGATTVVNYIIDPNNKLRSIVGSG